MNAYVFQAALLCEECALKTREEITLDMDWREGRPAENGDSNRWPQGPYTDGGGEADSPQHCDHCGLFLENPLTTDGYAYLRQTVQEQERANLPVWTAFYGV